MQTLFGVSFGAVLWIYTIICALIGEMFVTNMLQMGFIDGFFGRQGSKHFLLRAICRTVIVFLFFPSIIFMIIFALVFTMLDFLEDN